MTKLSIALITGLLLSMQVQAQSTPSQLELACNSDEEIGQYLLDILGSSPTAGPAALSADELAQIQSILDDPAVVNGTNREKYAAVMNACSTGQILTSRFG